MDQQHKGLLGLLALSALAVLQAVLAQRAAAAYQAALELQGLPEHRYRGNQAPRAVRDPKGSQDYPAWTEPRGNRDRLDLPESQDWMGSPVRPENREHRGPWERWDR